MDLTDIVGTLLFGTSKPGRSRSEEAARTLVLGILPLAEVCLFFLLADKLGDPIAPMAVLVPVFAGGGYLLAGLVGQAARAGRLALGCAGICLLADFAATFLMLMTWSF